MTKFRKIFINILNDSDIFDSKFIKGERLPILFEQQDWKNLKNLVDKNDKQEFKKMVEKRKSEIRNNYDLTKLCDSLIKSYNEKPYLLKELFETINWYGIAECKLPSMDQYGRVIERYNISIIEEYFLDKIERESKPHFKKALKKLLEYIKDFFDKNIPREEIAFFIRKLNSLTKYWEVLND